MHPENTDPIELQPAGVTSTPAAQRSRTPLIVGLLAVVVLSAVSGLFLGLRAANVGPFKDSGIAMCETLRDWEDNNVMGAGEAPDPGEQDKKVLAVRDQFADSRYDDIRDAGTRYFNFSRQIRALDTDSEVNLAPMIGPKLFGNWADLAGACANHGVTIPPLITGP